MAARWRPSCGGADQCTGFPHSRPLPGMTFVMQMQASHSPVYRPLMGGLSVLALLGLLGLDSSLLWVVLCAVAYLAVSLVSIH